MVEKRGNLSPVEDSTENGNIFQIREKCSTNQ